MRSREEKDGNWFSRHKILTGFLVLVVIGTIAVSVGGGDTSKQSPQQTATSEPNQQKPTEEKPSEPKKERLTVDEGWTLDQSNSYMTKVVGTVSNNSDKDIKGYIQVTFSAYDASDANVGDCLANANTVDANGKWKFEAMCSGSDISTVKFKDISGF